MRIRPFFWGLFALVCVGILMWAAIMPRQVPAQVSIHLMQKPSAARPTSLLVEVTDAQGVPIPDAQIALQAWMTTMPMGTPPVVTIPQGQGAYLVQVNLSMAGPWMIAILMHANGFAPLRQMVAVQVLSAFSPGSAWSEILQAPTESGETAWAAAMASRATA